MGLVPVTCLCLSLHVGLVFVSPQSSFIYVAEKMSLHNVSATRERLTQLSCPKPRTPRGKTHQPSSDEVPTPGPIWPLGGGIVQELDIFHRRREYSGE